MTVRAIIARVLLALLLVFAQQQALLHELQHGTEALSGQSQPGSPAHDVCLKCLSFAGFDNAPVATPPLLPAVALTHVLPARLDVPEHAALFVAAYRSRAPPFHS